MENENFPSVFTKKVLVTPSMCDATASLSRTSTFALFQDLASEHAEKIGVGGDAMTARGLFWLTAHVRVEFFKKAHMMQEMTAETWPADYGPNDFRCYRYYRLTSGEDCLALGKSMWAVSDVKNGGVCRIADAGFPAGFPFSPQVVCPDPLQRFTDHFTQDDVVCTHTVRASDTDFGGHMNNVAYFRVLLDSFSSKELAGMDIASLEIRYAHPCYEGQHLSVCRRRVENGWMLAVKREGEKASAIAQLKLRGNQTDF